MAGDAEQDNRVKIPDGTAAVCADTPFFWRKPVTEDLLGKAEMGAKTVLSQGMSQKTYEVCSPIVCEL